MVTFFLTEVLFYFVSFVIVLIVVVSGTEIFMSKIKSIKLLLLLIMNPLYETVLRSLECRQILNSFRSMS